MCARLNFYQKCARSNFYAAQFLSSPHLLAATLLLLFMPDQATDNACLLYKISITHASIAYGIGA